MHKTKHDDRDYGTLIPPPLSPAHVHKDHSISSDCPYQAISAKRTNKAVP